MKSLIVAVVALALFAASSVQAAELGHPSSPAELAARAVELVAQGEVQRAALLMHYPPTYTPDERKDDIAGNTDGLHHLLEEFGAMSPPKPRTEATEYYEIGMTGGDNAYLASLKPQHTAHFLYEAKFSKVGPGYVHVIVVQLTATSPLEVLGVYLGLPAEDPHSKPAMLAIARQQLVRMKVPITPELEQQIEQSLKVSRFPVSS